MNTYLRNITVSLLCVMTLAGAALSCQAEAGYVIHNETPQYIVGIPLDVLTHIKNRDMNVYTGILVRKDKINNISETFQITIECKYNTVEIYTLEKDEVKGILINQESSRHHICDLSDTELFGY